MDGETYGSGGSPEFVAAKIIFSQSCGGSCHQFHTMSEAQLISTGRVFAGNAENSPIYYRIVGSSGALGPKNMPSGSGLSAGERAQIKYWIDGL